MAFSCLNAATAFLIAWLMHMDIATFAIVAAIHRWDLSQKAKACQNAGMWFVVVTLCLFIYALCGRCFSSPPRLQRYEMELTDAREGAPLLRSQNIATGIPRPVPPYVGGLRHREGYGSSD
ncbi:hypothetical protein TRVL_01045 [Trypanosoma vivax]|nr:hypothetical protein TRVL_01045 [Trypanosoma vivax]